MQATFLAPNSFPYSGLKPLLRDLQLGGKADELVVDLSRVQFAFPGAMVPLAAILDELRSAGRQVEVRLPLEPIMAEYFDKAGWTAALLGTETPPAVSRRPTFVPIAQFSDHAELNAAVNATLDIVAAVAVYPSGVLKAIEWTLNEIADNVLLHAGPNVQGWMQAIATPKQGRIEFAVADQGRGILASLQERYADLTNDPDALERAIRPGVTRDASIGQGNGLSGSVRIAQSMNGWVNLLSGRGELRVSDDGSIRSQATPSFMGTLVDLTLPTTTEVDVADALWGREPTTTLELSHLVGDTVLFRLRDESSGFGNRGSGLALANKLSNLLNELPGERITVDFEESTSYPRHSPMSSSPSSSSDTGWVPSLLE